MTQDQKKKLLFFVTGSDRAPIKGLSDLHFVIRQGRESQAALPTAHTCFNTLVLPMYTTVEVLRSKLMLAIANAEGFGLK